MYNNNSNVLPVMYLKTELILAASKHKWFLIANQIDGIGSSSSKVLE